jgi:hypothetical protein
MTPKTLTYGWCSERDVTNQCSRCFWVLKEHRLSCCEFNRPEFPAAQHCEKFSEDGE